MPEELIESLPNRLEAELEKLLNPDETVLLKLKGAFKEGLVCTNNRVLIIKGGFMTGQMLGNNVFQLPYANIAGVQVQFHLMSGYFEISAAGMDNRPKSYWSTDKKSDPSKAPNCVSLQSSQRKKFQDACTFILEKVSSSKNGGGPSTPTGSGDVLAALEKLGQLKAAGVLSEAEFESKKADLLSRL